MNHVQRKALRDPRLAQYEEGKISSQRAPKLSLQVKAILAWSELFWLKCKTLMIKMEVFKYMDHRNIIVF